MYLEKNVNKSLKNAHHQYGNLYFFSLKITSKIKSSITSGYNNVVCSLQQPLKGLHVVHQVSYMALYCHKMYNLELLELCSANADYMLCYAWLVFLSQSTRKFGK